MAVILRYVDAGSSGGDGTTQKTSGSDAAYASLSAAIHTEATDLVTAGDSLHIICGGSTADTVGVENSATVAWPGMVTSATNDITIEAADDHGGTWNTAQYRLDTSSYFRSLGIPSDYHVTIIGLQVNNSRSGGGGVGSVIFEVIGGGSGVVTMDRCLLTHTGTKTGTGNFTGIRTNRVTGDVVITVRNTIIIDTKSTGTQLKLVATTGLGAMHLLNCTYVDCGQDLGAGISVSPRSGTGTKGSVRNCIVQNTTYDDYSKNSNFPPTVYTGTNNLSSDGTSGDIDSDSGATSIDNTSLTFVDAAARDYHLAATDTAAIGSGVNLYSQFTGDIDGDNTRPVSGAWDIGADQRVVAVTGRGPLMNGGLVNTSLINAGLIG